VQGNSGQSGLTALNITAALVIIELGPALCGFGIVKGLGRTD
jgi:hypothetical protein